MKMNMAQKVLLIIGGAFAGIGAVLTMIFGGIGMVFRPMSLFYFNQRPEGKQLLLILAHIQNLRN